jgi:N-acetyl-1-D-myo-inositol-2-amino-2-deoxy-alpha-D-glucopyranoside deacetylase
MTPNKLLIVHAHPDDEVFSTGGIIAKYARAGDRVVVVYGTRGEQGEMHDPERNADEASERLGEIREEEVRDALEILGASDLRFLGYRDSGMKDTEANQNPENFMNAPLDEATDRLLAIMHETGPDVVVTYDEGGGYGHPDHVMAHRVAVEAFNRAQGQPWAPKKLYLSARSREGFKSYAEGLKELDLKIPWMNGDFNFDEFGVPEAEITAIIDISDVAPLKKQALLVHRTQIPPDFFYFQIPDDALRRIGGKEFFERIAPPPRPDEHEDDLFAGIRAGQAAVA